MGPLCKQRCTQPTNSSESPADFVGKKDEGDRLQDCDERNTVGLLKSPPVGDEGYSRAGIQGTVSPLPKGPYAVGGIYAYAALKVYFDSGIHGARKGFRPRAHVGWAIFSEDATDRSRPLAAGLGGSRLGGAFGYWHREGKSLLDRAEEIVDSFPSSRGPQLFDLVAAHGALRQLEVNEYTGKVRMIGDGKQVIEFLSGRDDALHLEVAGEDLALTIRSEILRAGEGFTELKWEWVPSEENWADRILKRIDAELGDR